MSGRHVLCEFLVHLRPALSWYLHSRAMGSCVFNSSHQRSSSLLSMALRPAVTTLAFACFHSGRPLNYRVRCDLVGAFWKSVDSYAFMFVLACLVGSVTAADSDGDFWLGGGAGGVKCPDFVAAMEKGRSHGVGTIPYVRKIGSYTMYLLGFQTGYNMSTPATCDIFPGVDGVEGEYPLLSWAENYCRANPSQRFGDAVVSLARELHPKRKRVCTH